MSEQKKKIVIIGSGLGGLSCGVILAKNGYQVTVLEQSNQTGGCLQCFSRHGVKFETGMHFVGSADEGQTLQRLLCYLEADKDIHLSRLNPDGYDIIGLGGKQYKFANGRDAFIRQMTEYFPDQHDNLERYYDLIERIANASSLHSLKDAETDAAVNTEYQLRSIDEVIDATITDPLLAKVLVGNLPLYAAEKGKTPSPPMPSSWTSTTRVHSDLQEAATRCRIRLQRPSSGMAARYAHAARQHASCVMTHMPLGWK